VTGAAAEPTAAAVLGTGTGPAAAPPRRDRPQWTGMARRAAMFALALVGVCALWEAYKAVGSPDGGTVLGVRVLPRTDDTSMPHI